jgi:hypothetical protein
MCASYCGSNQFEPVRTSSLCSSTNLNPELNQHHSSRTRTEPNQNQWFGSSVLVQNRVFELNFGITMRSKWSCVRRHPLCHSIILQMYSFGKDRYPVTSNGSLCYMRHSARDEAEPRLWFLACVCHWVFSSCRVYSSHLPDSPSHAFASTEMQWVAS